MGWAASAGLVALCLSGLAALAMAMAPAGEALGEDAVITLLLPPPSPPLAAMTEPAPEVAAKAPSIAQEGPQEDTAPDLPEMTEERVERPTLVKPVPAPSAEALPQPGAALPPPPVPAQMAEREAKPEVQPRPEPPAGNAVAKPARKPVEKQAKAKARPVKKARKVAQNASAEVAASGGAAAQKPAAISAGYGKVAAAGYGATVLNKVRRTKKKKSPARGTATVGFAISASGGLSSVGILRSSGESALDQVALDHIRRAAPFPAPPAGAVRKFSFEFVGR